MHQSPRIRRLRSDLAALERLRTESTVFRFTAVGDPPQQYNIILAGKSLWRDRGRIKTLEQHRVEIKLGASYPRSIPEIRWLTPIFHPNISEIGMVCLGGYGTHWVPSVQLDDLCVMLWDMARYHNYDIRSPYNRDSALWVASQNTYRFPIDARPLRDLRASAGRGDSRVENGANDSSSRAGKNRAENTQAGQDGSATPVSRVLQFIERYGRGSKDEAARATERLNMSEALARISSQGLRDSRSQERLSGSGTSAEAPQSASSIEGAPSNESIGESAGSEAARELAPTASPEPEHPPLDPDRDDMVILGEVVNEPAGAGDDEIMFIS
jgi:ubiquitin-protein ligase